MRGKADIVVVIIKFSFRGRERRPTTLALLRKSEHAQT
jgi:hypothetical protein